MGDRTSTPLSDQKGTPYGYICRQKVVGIKRSCHFYECNNGSIFLFDDIYPLFGKKGVECTHSGELSNKCILPEK